jgi:Conjugative transposon protein TcpC
MPDHRPRWEHDPALWTARGAFPAPGRPVRRQGGSADGETGWWPALRWPPDGFSARAAGAVEMAEQPAMANSRRDSTEWTDWLVADLRAGHVTAEGAPFGRAGAPAGSAGRLAPEWSASGTSRRRSLRRALARADGGVMDRRALLDRGDEQTADESRTREASSAEAPSAEALSRREPRSVSRPPRVRSDLAAARWGGAGGRWLVWAARLVVWSVILLVGYRGVVAIVGGSSANAKSPSADHAAGQFPATAAEAYALEFGNVYLNFSPATAAARSKALAAFLPPGAAPQLGWNGSGTQRLLAEQVAGIAVRSGHAAVVTLLAQLAGGSLVELGVPIYASGDAMSVSGEPALLPGPVKDVAPSAGQSAGDQATETALQNQLAGFFEAYASGDQATLARFVTPGAEITGLGGEVGFGAIDAVYAPAGGSSRTISVTVSWLLPSQPAPRSAGAIASAPARLQMTYAMTVVKRDGTWDVRSIGAAAQPMAQGPP